MMEPLRVIISGGGTGGHIFPALAIANAIKEIQPTTEILFVGAEGKMEMEKVPAAGYSIIGLPIAGIQRSLTLKNLSFPFKLLRSFQKATQIIKEFKPDLAIGVGGYASGPTLMVAGLKKIPYFIQEQNSYPGITNKWLARKASKIFVAYDGMEKYFPAGKIIKTGNPVRKDITQLDSKRNEAFQYFNLDESKPVLLVVGGSQGALSINKSICAGLRKLYDQEIQLIWQTGKYFHQKALDALSEQHSKQLIAYEFIHRMDLAYSIADLVISRAGASTVSELSIAGKASIMVPLPTAAEDHQTKNIESLVHQNASIMVHDKNAFSELVDTALQLLSNKEKLDSIAANIKALALPGSAESIAKFIVNYTNTTI